MAKLILRLLEEELSADFDSKHGIPTVIKGIFRRHWPQWEGSRHREKLAKFTIKMDQCYLCGNFDEDLIEAFRSASKDMLQSQSAMSTPNST